MSDPAAPVAPAIPDAPEGAPDTTPAVPEPPGRPGLGELEAFASQAKQEREASEAADTDARELAEYRALKASGRMPTDEPAEPTPADARRMVAIEDLLGDPQMMRRLVGDDKAFRAYLNSSAKAAASPDVFGLGQRVDQLEARPTDGLEDLRTSVDKIEAREQRADASRRESAFVTASEVMGEGDLPAFPLLSRLPNEQRVDRAHKAIAAYQNAGVDISGMDNAELAGVIEQDLQSHLDLLTGGHESVPDLADLPTARGTGGDTRPKQTRKGRRSLTNELAAEGTATRRPLTEAERDAKMLALMAKQRQAHGEHAN